LANSLVWLEISRGKLFILVGFKVESMSASRPFDYTKQQLSQGKTP